MYTHCIFCSAGLGRNESLPRFPVGRTLAFDGGKGRLWAVCPRCARWNLAPLEERREVLEDAERRFRDCPLRAQRENIGLARLADGTRLVRVGGAGPGELAAWRYGRHLLRRRRGYLVAAGTVAATGAVAAAATTAALVAAVASLPMVLWEGEGVVTAAEAAYTAVSRGARRLWHLGTDGRPLLPLSPGEAAAAEGRRWLRKRDFRGAYLRWDDNAGAATVQVPVADGRFLSLEGPRARAALGRSLAIMNARGASPRQLEGAVRQLSDAGSAERWLERAARDGLTLELPARATAYWQRRSHHEGRGMSTIDWVRSQSLRVVGDRGVQGDDASLQVRAAALEMALHEETERRAMEGELAALEEMWRQAEEIASIADRLPDAGPGDVPAGVARKPRPGG
jgi:hypothetical protein